ncbi:hypothetical protein [Terasakiella sp.]|uniref:hypothetical protein n=1 Tax=Terasakiella sp. TaxID=2034861 RepID=UPI003AA9ABD0
MSSVAKPIASGNTSVPSSRPAGGSARQISSSQYNSVSELYAQAGVRGEDESRSFENYSQGQGQQNQSQQQPHTLKLHGTSRTFAMLFEDAQSDYDAGNLGESSYNADPFARPGKPAFQAYMERATSTYELSTRAIKGELKNRGGSINLAM